MQNREEGVCQARRSKRENAIGYMLAKKENKKSNTQERESHLPCSRGRKEYVEKLHRKKNYFYFFGNRRELL